MGPGGSHVGGSATALHALCEEAAQLRDLKKAVLHRAIVVVMDLMMPVMNGIEATRRIRATQPETKVLVLSMYDDEEYVQQLLAAGASGCMLKRATGDELVKAVREVVSGGMPLDPAVAARLVKDYVRLVQGQEEAAAAGALTPRELEVLKLVAEGHTNQDIADRLGLHDVTEVVKYALRHGIISLGPRPGASGNGSP